MKRNSKEERFHYKRHSSMNDFICWYCELPGFVADHHPPISKADYMIRLFKQEAWLIRSCDRCNLFLGDKTYPSIRLRQQAMRAELEYRIQVLEHFAAGGSYDYILAYSEMSQYQLNKLRKAARRGVESERRLYKWLK